MSDVETNAARKSSGLRAIAYGLGVNPDLSVAQKVIRDAADKIEELERERDEARRECKFLWDERDEAMELLASEKITRNHIIKRSVEVEQERDEARAERDILRLNSLGTIQLNIPVTTDWKEETK